MNKILIYLLILFFSSSLLAEKNIEQLKDSKKTYMDLIEDGFEVKAYDAVTINSDDGLTILLFISVLQKEKKVYECQEYQTLDKDMNTIDMSLVCRQLSQPYQRGLDT